MSLFLEAIGSYFALLLLIMAMLGLYNFAFDGKTVAKVSPLTPLIVQFLCISGGVIVFINDGIGF